MLLVTIAPGRQLAPAPAAAYARARAADAPPGVTSAWRSRAQQADLYADYIAGVGNLASPPGTSDHERGIALDLPDPAQSWPRWDEFGWLRTNTEPWHRVYAPSSDHHLIQTPTHQESEDMRDLIRACYHHLIGRETSDAEVDARLVELAGKSPTEVVAFFLGAPAEPSVVVKAFRDYLGHDPNAQQVTEWSRQPVAQVRAGVAGSPEALGKK